MTRYAFALLVISLLLSSCISEEEHNKLGTDLTAAKDSLTKVQDALQGLETKVAEKDQKITELSEQVTLLTEQNSTFTEKQPKLEQDLLDLQKQLSDVTKERDDIKASTAETTTTVRQLEKELSSTKEKNQKLLADYEALKSTNNNLKSRLDDLENRPRIDVLYDNSLVRYLRQQKKRANSAFADRDDLTEEELATLENNKNLLSKSNKELTAEMGDYYTAKGTIDQMSEKYPDFGRKYKVILKERSEALGGGN